MFKTKKIDCFNMWSNTNKTYPFFNVGTFNITPYVVTCCSCGLPNDYAKYTPWGNFDAADKGQLEISYPEILQQFKVSLGYGNKVRKKPNWHSTVRQCNTTISAGAVPYITI